MAFGKRREQVGDGKRSKPRVMFLGLRGIGGPQGGIETHVENLVRYLPYPPSEMVVIGRRPYRDQCPTEADVREPRVVWLPTIRHQSLEAIIHSLIGVVYACFRRPDILHIHGVGPNLVTPLAKLLGLKVVATHHGADYDREKWGRFAKTMLLSGERSAVLKSNACISVSPIVAETVKSRYGAVVDYVPNGVVDPRLLPPGATLRHYGLTEGRYILNVGRIVPEKRQDDLVRAFARIDDPTLRLVLAGGSDHETDYSRELRNLAAADPRVIMTGFLKGEPLQELYSNAGLFVLPSSHEGLPIALLEAMSYGRQFIVSDLPVYGAMGLPEEAVFGVGNVEELTRHLREFSAAAYRSVDWRETLEPYRWENVARLTDQVYARAVASNGHANPA